MKLFYWLFAAAILLDLVIVPWLFGVGWLVKFVLALLPFAFLFFDNRHTAIIFAASLIYFRLASSFNLGILFLALGACLVFERWFLINFFHRRAWQTLVLSSLGIVVFYLVLLGFSRLLIPAQFYLSASLIISAMLSVGASVLVNFIFQKIYSHVQPTLF